MKSDHRPITTKTAIGLLTLICFAVESETSRAQSDHLMLNRWEVDPLLPGVWISREEPASLEIHFGRLKADDVQSQLDEVRRIIRYIDLPEVVGKKEACEYFLQRLTQGGCDRLLKQSMLSVLEKLGNPEMAPVLWEVAKSEPEVRNQIETILIRWKSRLPLDEWRRRLDSANGELVDLVQAVNGIETIRDPDDAKRLETVLRKSGMPVTVKIPVAKALGEIVSNGLEPLAAQVLQSNQSQRELLVASLLARHTSQQASVVQRQLVDSSNSAVVAIAYRSLSKFHPDLARELAISLCKHTDSHVRDLAIDVLSRHSDKQELVALVQCFEDENLRLRDKACKILVEKAKIPESKPLISELSNEMFQSAKSFAIEQAIILSVQMELRDRCRRFLELLDYPEENVRIRAGWALQELANTPDIVEAVYAYTLPVSEKLKRGELIPYADGFKLAHLLHVFGTNKVKSSEAMLRLYVPELDQRMNPIARAGAIWSLGIILEGTQDVALCEELKERFLDLGPPSEFENVRYACAIAMGRIAGMQETDFFNSTGEPNDSKMGQAADWAIAKQKEILSRK